MSLRSSEQAIVRARVVGAPTCWQCPVLPRGDTSVGTVTPTICGTMSVTPAGTSRDGQRQSHNRPRRKIADLVLGRPHRDDSQGQSIELAMRTAQPIYQRTHGSGP